MKSQLRACNSRLAKVAISASISLLFDGFLWFLVWREARVKDSMPSVYWWLLTFAIAVAAIIPLFKIAQNGRVIDRVLAGFLSLPPVGWVAFCGYVAFR
jgi:hypothetical protein